MLRVLAITPLSSLQFWRTLLFVCICIMSGWLFVWQSARSQEQARLSWLLVQLGLGSWCFAAGGMLLFLLAVIARLVQLVWP